MSGDPAGEHTSHNCTPSYSSKLTVTITDAIYSLTDTHNRPCIITGGDSRRVSQKQAGIRTGVSSWLGQTGVKKRSFVAPSVAFVA